MVCDPGFKTGKGTFQFPEAGILNGFVLIPSISIQHVVPGTPVPETVNLVELVISSVDEIPVSGDILSIHGHGKITGTEIVLVDGGNVPAGFAVTRVRMAVMLNAGTM